MSTAKLPTRSRPDDGRFRGGRLRLVEGVCHPDPPPAPDHLSRRERELFQAAWREPESTLWRRSESARVARWAHLAARAATDPASWVFTQLNVLERQLVMTPLARAAAGVTYGHVLDEFEDQPRIAAGEAIRAARATGVWSGRPGSHRGV